MTRRFALLAALVAITILVVGCGGGPAPTSKGSIEGWVYSRGTTYTVSDTATAPSGYLPVVGATVTVVGDSVTATTDGNGHFRLDNVSVGDRTVSVSTSDWAGRFPATVTANSVTKVLSTPKTWTVMIYGVTDLSLKKELTVILNELKTVGTNATINVVAQVGQYDDTSPSPQNAQRILVANSGNVVVQNLGDMDLGNKTNLKNFVDWAWANYPAQHHMLVTYSHGDGWTVNSSSRSMTSKSTRPGIARVGGNPQTRGILYDLNHSDNVDIDQFATALNGKQFEFVILNHCITQCIEVAYELRGIADYVVGSEALAARYSYDSLISRLNSAPSDGMGAVQAMLTGYVSNMSSWNYPVTASIVDTTKLDALATSLNALAAAINANSTTLTNVSKTVATNTTTQVFSDFGDTSVSYGYADIYDLAKVIANGSGIDSATKSAAQDVMMAVTPAVVFNRAANGTVNPMTGNASGLYSVNKGVGLMVAYPSSSMFNATSARYNLLKFGSTETAWATFLTNRGSKL